MDTSQDPTPPAASNTDALAATIASGAQGKAVGVQTLDELPDRLGRYRLVRKLGEGGMGIVHLAHDDQLDRPVAIKILRPEGDGDPRRLLREARSMARISHPHIAAVYDVGTHGHNVYVAMEYIEGPTLRQWSAQAHSFAERHSVLLQAARGLAGAHASDVVHRDFKPDNVIVGLDGRVRVLDFGLAKLAPGAMSRERDSQLVTQAGALAGTPRYMAPEQLRAQPAGPAADQFAFCVTAYEMAYGTRPFSGEVFADLVISVLTQEPLEPAADAGVPTTLWPVLLRGLQVDETQRHPSMQALADALEALAEPVAEATPAVVSRPAVRDAREQARQHLTQAFAEDLLSADEIDERLELLENATELAAIDALLQDLRPQEATPPEALAVAEPQVVQVLRGALPAVVDRPAEGSIIAVFGGSQRAGAWTPARVNKIYTLFGGAEIDLREAILPEGTVEIQILAAFGGVEIIVQPGARVQLDCTAIFGAAEQQDPTIAPDPGATLIRITGFVAFGGVEVCERLPGESARQARKRRKALKAAAHRRALPPKT